MTTAFNESEMFRRFQRFSATLTGGDSPGPANFQSLTTGWFNVLAGLYGRPDRAYHTFAHLDGMLAGFDRLKAKGEDAGHLAAAFGLELETAIWFHDAVYTFGNPENEEQSAWLAMAFLQSLCVPEKIQERVRSMILCTTHRASLSPATATAVLLDLDLASLAAPWDEFMCNNADIRKEAIHLTDETFRWGQVAFLGGLMRRPAIFYALFELEAPARRNVEKYLAGLIADRL